MSMALQLQDNREQCYSRLKLKPMMSAAGDVPMTVNGVITPNSHVTPNHEWLACMVASWCAGQGVLPDYLGLEPDQFKQLTDTYFQGCSIPEQAPSGSQAGL